MTRVVKSAELFGAPLQQIPYVTVSLVNFHHEFVRILKPFNPKQNRFADLSKRVCFIAMSLFVYPALFSLALIGAFNRKNGMLSQTTDTSLCRACEKKWTHHLPVQLEGKIAIVTGGANGIGKAIVQSLAALGAVPVIVDFDEKNGGMLCAEITEKGQQAHFLKTDLTNEEACRSAIEDVIAKYGKLDILINNAGNNDKVSIRDGNLERFEKSLKINLSHYFTMSKFAWNHLKETQGNIVMIGSKVALTGQGGAAGYAAAKGAILGLTRELALEGCIDNIRVNSIIPAEVDTANYMNWINTFTNPAEKLSQICDTIPFQKRLTSPHEIAHTVVFIASELSSHTTGQHLIVDGGYTNLDRAFF